MTESLRQEFLRSLLAAGDGGQDAPDRDRRFVRALLAFGSETDDNLRCTDRVGLLALPGPDRTGLALRGSGLPLADLLNAAEGAPVPPQLAEDFPGVTQDDWDAVLRLATLVFVALEQRADPAPPKGPA